MLKLDFETKRTSNSASVELINDYLQTLTQETSDYNSSKKVKQSADGIIQEYSFEGKLNKISSADVKLVEKKVKDAKKEYGVRAVLNYHNRGFVQDILQSTMAEDMPLSCKIADVSKGIVAMGVSAVAVGAVAQAVFGQEDMDKYMGASFEKLAQNFMLGNDHYDSLMPAVTGTIAAIGAAKIGVTLIAGAHSKKEMKDFQSYADLKHAQVGLKRLKKAVMVHTSNPNKEKQTMPTMADVIQRKDCFR